MTTAEVAECRWWAWAREKAGSGSLLQKEVQLLIYLHISRDHLALVMYL